MPAPVCVSNSLESVFKKKSIYSSSMKQTVFASLALPFPCCIVFWFLKCREMHTSPCNILTFLDLRVFKNADKVQLLNIRICALPVCLTDPEILAVCNISMGNVF